MTPDWSEKFPLSFNRLPKAVQNFSSWLSAEHCKEVGLFLSRVIQSMSSGKSAPELINKCIVTILQTIGSLLAVQGKVEPSLKKNTVKPVVSGHSKIDKTRMLITNGTLMKVKSIAECSPWSILQYFWPALSDNSSWKPIFFWETA